MAMKKTDYEIVAAILKLHNRGISQLTIEAVAQSLATAFKLDNPDFKRDLFLSQCGVSE